MSKEVARTCMGCSVIILSIAFAIIMWIVILHYFERSLARAITKGINQSDLIRK